MRFSLFSHHSNPCRIAACVAAVLVCAACQNIPKYKKSSGKFNEWASFEGKHFEPSSGTVTAVDPVLNTVTIRRTKETRVFPVSPTTRIMHETADITLAELPLNKPVKFTLSSDGQRLLTIWYGHELASDAQHAAGKHKGPVVPP
jgi:hypothetical protein